MGLSTGICGQSLYRNEAHQFQLGVPVRWVMDSQTPNRVSWKSEAVSASISISVWTLSGAVAAPDWQYRVASEKFDGWASLLQRSATDYEISRAQVDSAAVGVYSTQELDEQQNISEVIVGEYYFIKQNKGYIVSIRAPRTVWPDIEQSVKTMMDSFWVGSGQRQLVAKPALKSLPWLMAGGNKENQRVIADIPTRSLSLAWEAEWPSGSVELYMTTDRLFVLQNGLLQALDANSGGTLWQREGVLSVALSNTAAFVVAQQLPNQKNLESLQLDTGKRQWQAALAGTKPCSPVIVVGQRVYVVDGDALEVFQADTGRKAWSKSAGLNPVIYPVVVDRAVLVAPKKGGFLAFQTETGKSAFSLEGGSPIWAPVVYRHVILTAYKAKDGLTVLQGIDDRAGALLWEVSGNMALAGPPSLANDGFVLPVNAWKEREVDMGQGLVSIDLYSGFVQWTTPVALGPSGRIWGGRHRVLSQSQSGMVLLDADTGESFVLPKVLAEASQVRFFKDLVLVISSNGPQQRVSAYRF